jgi:integrase
MIAPQNFSALFDLFISLRSSYVRKTTVRDTFIPTQKAVLRIMGDPVAKDVTSLDILLFIQTLLTKRKASGINANLRVLKSFGRWCAEQELLPDKNAWARVKMLRVQDKPIRWLTREEFRRIFNAEKSMELRRIYFWAILTGLRAGDLLRLRADDVDLRSRGLRVVSSKSGHIMMLPLHPELINLLTEMPAGRDGLLWTRKYTVSYISHRFLRAARAVKIMDVSLHTLRKSFGSWLVKGGANIFEVQKLMGHSSPVLTAKYYAHLIPSELGRYVLQLAAVTGSVPVEKADDLGANMDYTSSVKVS